MPEIARPTNGLETVWRPSSQFVDGSSIVGMPPGVRQEEAAQAVRKLGQCTCAIEGQLRAIAGVELARGARGRASREQRVGVAHGSSIDDHMACMPARAMAHAHVLPLPGPRVASADFGDNTLMHGVCLWLDIGASANGSGVRASCAG